MPRITKSIEKLKNAAGIEEKLDFSTTNIEYSGLNLPTFNPEQYIAPNLFTDSSPLEPTDRVNADKIIQSISQKRETLRVISANLSLNTDALKVGSLSEKMSQAGIDFSVQKITTSTKQVGIENAQILQQTALAKLGQTSEKYVHETITLEGLKLETEQRKRYWLAKIDLQDSRIRGIELAKYSLEQKIGSIEAESEVIE
jgi:hypothetical protein